MQRVRCRLRLLKSALFDVRRLCAFLARESLLCYSFRAVTKSLERTQMKCTFYRALETKELCTYMFQLKWLCVASSERGTEHAVNARGNVRECSARSGISGTYGDYFDSSLDLPNLFAFFEIARD